MWDRGPYHWTRECIEGRALVDLDRRVADTMANLRPCRLCAGRDRRKRRAATGVARGSTVRTAYGRPSHQ
jgi:hypothetical protein